MLRIAILLSVLAVLGGVWWWLARGEVREPAAAPPLSPPPTAAVPASPQTAVPFDKPAAGSPAVDRSRQLELPDGTFVPALNGAVGAAPLATYWGATWPWSPIVGTERSSAGLDWYRHADGSYSTTQMVWRSDLDRYDAMTRVAHPGGEPAPTAPERGR